MTARIEIIVSLVAVAGWACGGDAGPTIPPPGDLEVELALELVAGGLDQPVFLTAPAGDGRLFVVEQPGRIVVVDGGELLGAPFLDIRSRVSDGGERGLLGMAFHPAYATNGQFYVSYTDNGGDSRVDRFVRSADPDRADETSGANVLTVAQPFANHNGGDIAFGPDGMLYVALGDGGSGNDPLGSGQDVTTLLGSLLRLDVDAGSPYAVPPDNPFVGSAAGRGEIWAYGLRNPWRFSFDAAAGTVYVADVGQSAWEEVNVQPADLPGVNYGWNVMEGQACRPGGGACDMSGLTLPDLVYENSPSSCAVVGGYAYRGAAIPEVAGHYFYSDFCGGWLRSFRYDAGSVTDQAAWSVASLSAVRSFGRDAAGEVYVLAGSSVYRIVKRQAGG